MKKFNPDELADAVVGFSGSWIFVIVHAVWFVLWIWRRWDINLLTLIVSLEAIFLATFVLMSGNRTQARTDALMQKILQLESTLDQHVNVTAKEHQQQIAENTALTRELHEMITLWKGPMDTIIARALRVHSAKQGTLPRTAKGQFIKSEADKADAA